MDIACWLFVICYPLRFMIDLKADVISLNGCHVENLQETACGGSVLSTGCRKSSDFLQSFLRECNSMEDLEQQKCIYTIKVWHPSI